MKEKHIIIVLGALQIGGSEKQALILAKYLQDKENCKVEIWGFQNGDLSNLCDKYGISWRVISWKANGNILKLFSGLIKFVLSLRSAKSDVILSYTPYPNVICGLIWRFTGAKLYIWNQRDEGICGTNIIIEMLAARMTSLFVANSQGGKNFLIDSLKVKYKSVRIVHNGVFLDTPKSDRREWRLKLGIKENQFVACMIANLSKNKDHETLLMAWKLVVDKIPSAILFLAGREDVTYEYLVNLRYQLDLTGNVMFLGQVDDISGLLSSVDIGILSSKSEGCPNGVLESMAAGLAVVGTDIPGIREVLGNGVFLSKSGDAETMATHILMIAENKKMWEDVGGDNKKRIEQLFSVEKMGRDMVSLIR